MRVCSNHAEVGPQPIDSDRFRCEFGKLRPVVDNTSVTLEYVRPRCWRTSACIPRMCKALFPERGCPFLGATLAPWRASWVMRASLLAASNGRRFCTRARTGTRQRGRLATSPEEHRSAGARAIAGSGSEPFMHHPGQEVVIRVRVRVVHDMRNCARSPGVSGLAPDMCPLPHFCCPGGVPTGVPA